MSTPRRSLVVTMPVTEILHCRDDPEWACCLNCGTHLGIVQPETEEPGRFVGTCSKCRRWYLLDWHHEPSEGLMVLLPDHGELMRLWAGKVD